MRDNDRLDELRDGYDDIYTVTEIGDAIRQSLESEFPAIKIIGEIANFRTPASGHLYFTLRDEASKISAVIFRRQAAFLGCEPADGMLVVVSGRITHYTGSGQTQIIAQSMEPAGRGEMELEFRRLLQKLEDEGLTSPERKRPIPRYPERIVVMTSPTGAVIEDIIDTLGRRWPVAEIVHIHCDVQGAGAGPMIVRAFDVANGLEGVDTVILARGGGSIEDLWTFNTEAVARAVASSVHPVITGIGHEIDTTIVDYVSDLRAATPTASAELASPAMQDVRSAVDTSLGKLSGLYRRSADERLSLVDYLLRSSAFPMLVNRIESSMLRLDDLAARMRVWWEGTYTRTERVIERAAALGSSESGERLRAIEGRLARAERRLAFSSPAGRIEPGREIIGRHLHIVQVAVTGSLAMRRREVAGRTRVLRGLHPRRVLERGYAFCTTGDGETLVGRSKGLRKNDAVLVNFYDGSAACTVEKKRKGTAWPKR